MKFIFDKKKCRICLRVNGDNHLIFQVPCGITPADMKMAIFLLEQLLWSPHFYLLLIIFGFCIGGQQQRKVMFIFSSVLTCDIMCQISSYDIIEMRNQW